MATPDKGARRTWRFRLDDATTLEVSAPVEATEKQVRRRGRWSLVLGTLVASIVVAATAGAAVWTDQQDYAPGSVVTISGDNSNGVGYLGGETVSVAVSGPNGYEAACDAVADENGAWSCEVTLWNSELAEGPYSYTATGLTSGTSEAGAFTDHGPSPVTDDNYSITADASHLMSVSVDLGGGSASVTLTAASMKVANVTDGGTSDISLTGPGTATGNGTWTASFQGACGKTYKINNTSVTWRTGHEHTSTETPSTGEGTDQVATNACPPANTAPVVTAGDESFDEGTSETYTASWTDTDASQSHTCTIDFGDGPAVAGNISPTQPSNSGTCSASHAYADGPNSYTIQVSVSDGSTSGSDSASATVTNVRPTIALTGAASVDEGSPYSLTLGAITDPGSDTVTDWIVHWGDGNTQTFTGVSAGDVKTHTYSDGPANRTITVDLIDEDDTHLAAGTKAITVDNVKPTIALTGDPSVDEGSPYSLTLGAITDPGTDTVTDWIVHWGDGNTQTFTGVSAGDVKTHTYSDGPANRTITVDLIDEDDTHLAAGTKAITVDNVKPTPSIDSLTGVGGAACIGGNQVALGFSWTDPAGTNDSYSYSVDWGDGSASTTQSNATSPVTGLMHTYSAGGPYTIVVTVNDEDPGAGKTATSSTFSFLYTTSGILQPINTNGSRSSFKIGSTIPVKIRVTDCNGISVAGLNLKVRLQKLDGTANPVNETVETSVPDAGDVMRYDSSASPPQYIYNLSTKRSQLCSNVPCTATGDLTPGTYRVTVYSAVIASASADIDTR